MNVKVTPGMSLGSFVDAKTGKGRWLYVGLGLWRQVSAETERAYQLLANLISLPEGTLPDSAVDARGQAGRKARRTTGRRCRDLRPVPARALEAVAATLRSIPELLADSAWPSPTRVPGRPLRSRE